MLYDEFTSEDMPTSLSLLAQAQILTSHLIGKWLIAICLASVIVNGYFFINMGKSEQAAAIAISGKENLEPTEIVVDLSGAVERPGIYKLEKDARVADLLVLGGSLQSSSSASWVSKSLNLSQKLSDSQKVYIPFEWELAGKESISIQIPVKGTQPVTPLPELASDKQSADQPEYSAEKTESTKININTASQSELESLSGIGKVYAQRIIENRPYITTEELQVKANIPKSTLEKIGALIAF